jgi:anti-anti-sigma factor
MAPEAREICGPGLKLRITYAEDDPVVDCIGRLTSENTALLKSHVREMIPQRKVIILNLNEVTYMDSSGLGTVVGLYVSAKTRGCHLQLVNLSKRVRELLGLTDLLSAFETCGRYGTRMP